jgi:hypothetical protein
MRLSVYALVFAAIALPRMAMASDPAAAQVLFNQARQAVRAGDYASACPMFEESQRLDAAIGTKFNLADCYEHEGRTASAWALFLEVAGATKVVGQGAREQAARARAEALVPRLSTIVIAAPASAVDGLEVTRDGATVGAAQWGKPIPIDPGKHAFVASAPGRTSWQTTVKIAAGARRVSLVIPELSVAPVPEPPAVAASPDESTHGDGSNATAAGAGSSGGLGAQKVTALIVGAVGVVGLTTGAVFGIVSLSKHDSSEQGCNAQSACSQPAAATRTEAIHAGNVSTAAFVIGAAAVTAGIVVWVTAPSGRVGGGTSVGFAPMPNGAAMVGTW